MNSINILQIEIPKTHVTVNFNLMLTRMWSNFHNKFQGYFDMPWKNAFKGSSGVHICVFFFLNPHISFQLLLLRSRQKQTILGEEEPKYKVTQL